MKLLLLLSLIILPFTAIAADWPTFQGGAGRNAVSDEAFRIPDRVKWIINLREDLTPAYKPVEFAVPVVSGEMVYLGASLKKFYCLSAKDGSVIWEFKTTAAVESTATIWEDSVYFGDNSGSLYALSKKDGTLLWKYEPGSEILSSPLAVKGILYVTNTLGDVYALDGFTGKKLWQYRRAVPKGFSIRGSSSPSYDGLNVYVGFSDGYVAALQPFDGTLVWEKRLAEPKKQFKDIDASPVPDGDSLYVPFYDGSLYSLSSKDGSINWKFDEGGSGSPAVTKDAIILPSSGGAVYSLNKTTGKQNWAHKLDKAVPSSLIVVGGYVIFGLSNDGVEALSVEKGDEKWKDTPGSGVYGGLAYANGHLYFLSNGGFVYAVPCK